MKPQPIDYRCRDCGGHVSAINPPEPGIRCHGCQWVANVANQIERDRLQSLLIARSVIGAGQPTSEGASP